MKHTLSALALSLGLSFPALASAQEISSKANMIFSVDRLVGFSSSHYWRENPPGDDIKSDWTNFGFGWRGTPQVAPFDIPRFAFDYLIIDHLSVGGSLGYASVSLDDPDVSVALFEIAPRVGYIYSFGRVVSIWPRGGFTYHSAGADPGDSENGFALTLECPFTFSPIEHVAFHVGPTFDIDMFGTHDPEMGDNNDQGYRSFGIAGGMLVWL